MKKEDLIDQVNKTILGINNDHITVLIGEEKFDNDNIIRKIDNKISIYKQDIKKYVYSLFEEKEVRNINISGKNAEMLVNVDVDRRYLRSNLIHGRHETIHINDPKYKVSYNITSISIKYFFNLLLNEKITLQNFRLIFRRRYFFRSREDIFLERDKFLNDGSLNKESIIEKLIKISIGNYYQVLRIKGNKEFSIQECKKYFLSFIFVLNLNGIKVRPSENAEDFFGVRDIFHIQRFNTNIEPPYQQYDEELVHLYSNAIWSDNPFTQYIMFYQILESFFTRISEDSLVNYVKNEFTNPKLSFRDDNQLLELCIAISNKQQESKTEQQQLIEVLKHFIKDFNEIKKDLTEDQIAYYKSNQPEFINMDKRKITFDLNSSNIKNNIKPIAERIYNVRNALVHNKSNRDNNYDPTRDYTNLMKEVPLIRAIAEKVMIDSSSVL